MTKFTITLSFLIIFAFSAKAQIYQTPDWMQDIPTYGEISAIGISDPRVSDKDIAHKQSEIRAKAMIALLHDMDIAYTSEYFQSETEEHLTYKLEEIIEKLGRFKARLPYNPKDFSIIDSISNKNGEVLMLMGWEDTDYPKNRILNVSCEMYSKEYESSNTNAYAASELYEMIILDSSKNGISTYKYNIKADKRDIQIISINDGVTTKPPGYSYSYNNTVNKVNMTNFDASDNLNKGLWQAYFKGFLQATSEDSKNFTSKLKNLEDMFNEGREDAENYEGSTKQQELSRQVVKNRMNFYLHNLCINQNTLYINISTPQLNELPPKRWVAPIVADSTINKEPIKRSFWDKIFGRNKNK